MLNVLQTGLGRVAHLTWRPRRIAVLDRRGAAALEPLAPATTCDARFIISSIVPNLAPSRSTSALNGLHRPMAASTASSFCVHLILARIAGVSVEATIPASLLLEMVAESRIIFCRALWPTQLQASGHFLCGSLAAPVRGLATRIQHAIEAILSSALPFL